MMLLQCAYCLHWYLYFILPSYLRIAAEIMIIYVQVSLGLNCFPTFSSVTDRLLPEKIATSLRRKNMMLFWQK
jgi:hypothetical protein